MNIYDLQKVHGSAAFKNSSQVQSCQNMLRRIEGNILGITGDFAFRHVVHMFMRLQITVLDMSNNFATGMGR